MANNQELISDLLFLQSYKDSPQEHWTIPFLSQELSLTT